MKKTVREILVKLVFDEEWEEYVDEHVDIVIEDSGIECALKDGITMEVMSDNMFDDRRIDKNMQARMSDLGGPHDSMTSYDQVADWLADERNMHVVISPKIMYPDSMVGMEYCLRSTQTCWCT